MVASLVIAGCAVAARNCCGWAAAHLAARHGFTAVLEKLLMAGFSPDTPRGRTGSSDGRYGDTALHLAAQSGSLEVHLAPCALSHL